VRRLKDMKAQLAASSKKQISLTDPDPVEKKHQRPLLGVLRHWANVCFCPKVDVRNAIEISAKLSIINVLNKENRMRLFSIKRLLLCLSILGTFWISIASTAYSQTLRIKNYNSLEEAVQGSGVNISDKDLQQLDNIFTKLNDISDRETELRRNRRELDQHEYNAKQAQLRFEKTPLNNKRIELLKPYLDTLDAYIQLAKLKQYSAKDIDFHMARLRQQYKRSGIEISETLLSQIKQLSLKEIEIANAFQTLVKKIETGEKLPSDFIALENKLQVVRQEGAEIRQAISVQNKTSQPASTFKRRLELSKQFPQTMDIAKTIESIKNDYARHGAPISKQDLDEIKRLHEEINATPKLTPEEQKLDETTTYQRGVMQIYSEEIKKRLQAKREILSKYKRDRSKRPYFSSGQAYGDARKHFEATRIRAIKHSYSTNGVIISDEDLEALLDFLVKEDELKIEANTVALKGLEKPQNRAKFQALKVQIEEAKANYLETLQPYREKTTALRNKYRSED